MNEFSIDNFLSQMGITHLSWGNVLMWAIGLTLIYLAIKKKYEPLLLLPIGFGVLVVNLPMTPLMGEQDVARPTQPKKPHHHYEHRQKPGEHPRYRPVLIQPVSSGRGVNGYRPHDPSPTDQARERP